MPAARFNPMTYAKSLEEAGVNRAQAEAHAQGLADLQASLRTDFAGLRADFVDLRNDFTEFRVEMHKEFADFRVEMHKEFNHFKIDMVKWMIGLYILQTGTTITIIKYLH